MVFLLVVVIAFGTVVDDGWVGLSPLIEMSTKREVEPNRETDADYSALHGDAHGRVLVLERPRESSHDASGDARNHNNKSSNKDNNRKRTIALADTVTDADHCRYGHTLVRRHHGRRLCSKRPGPAWVPEGSRR